MDYAVLAAYLLAFGLAELLHELGHYGVGRLWGFSCGEMSIGLGPTLFSCTRGGTVWRLRLLPLGSACVLRDFDRSGKKWQQLAVILAGPGVNLLLSLGLGLALGSDWEWIRALTNFDLPGVAGSLAGMFPLRTERLPEHGALISFCLGVLNLLPLPGFDGGRAVAAVLRRGKKNGKERNNVPGNR